MTGSNNNIIDQVYPKESAMATTAAINSSRSGSWPTLFFNVVYRGVLPLALNHDE